MHQVVILSNKGKKTGQAKDLPVVSIESSEKGMLEERMVDHQDPLPHFLFAHSARLRGDEVNFMALVGEVDGKLIGDPIAPSNIRPSKG
jgi:hypothetical protein